MNLKINCGGGAIGDWIADGYLIGGEQTNLQFTVADVSGVPESAPNDVYRTSRRGFFTYEIPGFSSRRSYRFRLHTAVGNPYDRVGDYTLNGELILDDFNLTAAGGYQVGKAIVREFIRQPDAQGRFVLNVASTYDQTWICGIEIIEIPPPPVRFEDGRGYDDCHLLPRAGLELLYQPHSQDLQNLEPMSELIDHSGKNRHASVSGLGARYFKNHVAGKSVTWHDDVRAPFRYDGAFEIKHLFLVASVGQPAFSLYRGLLSDTNPATAGMLVGNKDTGKFYDLSASYPGYSYRTHGLQYPNDDQRAPVSDVFPSLFEIIELQFPAGVQMSGLQIGMDRNYPDRRWFGGFGFLAAYSELKNDCERANIYQFLATNFQLWERDGSGTHLFPFPANRGRAINNSDDVLLFRPEIGNRITKTISGWKQAFNVERQARVQAEYDAATEFLKQHPSDRSFIFCDRAFIPPRYVKGFRVSGITASDSSFARWDYSFKFEEE